MKAKEKATELVHKFIGYAIFDKEGLVIPIAKKCALIAVDEIYFALYNYLKDTDELQNADREFAYWNQVKSEIELL